MSKEDSGIWKEGKRDQYLEGLKRYRNKGVPIVIDGEELPETDWGEYLK